MTASIHDRALATGTAQRRCAAAVALSRSAIVAFVAVVAVVGVVAFAGGDDDDPAPAAAVALRAEAEDPTMGMCIEVTPATLRDGAELALRGTVTSVDGTTATLAVSQWYLGGSAEEVTVTGPQEVETALLGGVPLEQDGDYLLVAVDGVVRSCGQSGEATPQLEALYAEAFG